MNHKHLKLFLIFFLILSTVFDFISFIISNTKDFETNPLYLLTGSILLITLIKFGVVLLAAYIFHKDRFKIDVMRFGLILGILYVIVAQVLGGVSNLQVTHAVSESPTEMQPMPQDQAIKTYAVLNLLYIYFPLIMALLAFKIWEKCYYRNQQPKEICFKEEVSYGSS